MNLAIILKLFHIIAAIWFISGLLGRNLAAAQARGMTELGAVESLARLARVFDNRMVIPGSQLVFVLGLFAAWAGGLPLLGSLQGTPTNWILVSIVLFLSTLVPLVFVLVPRRRVFERALQEAVARGKMTSELERALSDRRVEAARLYELLIVAIIVVLMVTKPF